MVFTRRSSSKSDLCKKDVEIRAVDVLKQVTESEISSLESFVKKALKFKDSKNKELTESLIALENIKDSFKDRISSFEKQVQELKKENGVLKVAIMKKCCVECDKKTSKIKELNENIETMKTEVERLKVHNFKKKCKLSDMNKLLYARDEAIEALNEKIKLKEVKIKEQEAANKMVLKEYDFLNGMMENSVTNVSDITTRRRRSKSSVVDIKSKKNDPRDTDIGKEEVSETTNIASNTPLVRVNINLLDAIRNKTNNVNSLDNSTPSSSPNSKSPLSKVKQLSSKRKQLNYDKSTKKSKLQKSSEEKVGGVTGEVLKSRRSKTSVGRGN